jgi:glyoxylase-like metal-dependent hydrolase (beta-lactamase superfamily II)
MYVYKKPVELLADYGLAPEDITDIIITHAHPDHIGCISEYKRARIYIQKNQYSPEIFLPEQEIFLFDEEFDLTDNIKIKCISGHDNGSSVIFAGKYLLCGDEAYYYRNLTDRVRVNNCYSKENAQAFVEKYSKSELIPLLYHDPSIMPKAVGFEEMTK